MFKKELYIIGISGKMRRGKDTVANYLEKKYNFKRVGFGDKLKEICMNYNNSTDKLRQKWNVKIAKELYNDNPDDGLIVAIDTLMQSVQSGVWKRLTYDECYDHKTNFSRKVLQKIGEGARCVRGNKDCWVKYVINKCKKEGGRFAICDMRYKNEAYFVMPLKNSQIWRIERNMEVEPFGGDHISEIDLDDFNCFEVVLYNNGTIEELYGQIDKFIVPFINGQNMFSGEYGDVY